jgi:hypothetical protein
MGFASGLSRAVWSQMTEANIANIARIILFAAQYLPPLWRPLLQFWKL